MRWRGGGGLGGFGCVVLGQAKALGVSFQLVIRVRIEATRSGTERWALRLIHFVVSSANQRSTRFSQEL